MRITWLSLIIPVVLLGLLWAAWAWTHAWDRHEQERLRERRERQRNQVASNLRGKP